MKKEKKGGKLIIAFGTISIVLVTVCAFCKKDIIYKYYEYTVNKNYMIQKMHSRIRNVGKKEQYNVF